jgi:hypothetical protein
VVLPPGGAEAVTLWGLHTHALPAADVSPILAVTSPTKRCGKSTLLSLLAALVRRALAASNISPAAVFRAVQAYTPTLRADEADSFLASNEERRSVLNSSHTRATAYVVRVERLRHYFGTHISGPGEPAPPVSVENTHGSEEALRVIAAAIEDEHEAFG